MKNWWAIGGFMILAACAGQEGSNSETGSIRQQLAGKVFLNESGDVIWYGPGGEYQFNDGVIGSYAIVGSNVYITLPDGVLRSVSIDRTSTGLAMRTFNQGITPLLPVQSTLKGFGRIREGADCPNSAAETSAVMRLTKSTWSITMPGRRYTSGLLDREGRPTNGSGQRVEGFTGERHNGFFIRGACIMDWDLARG